MLRPFCIIQNQLNRQIKRLKNEICPRAFFPAKTNRNKITPPKSHFTYAIKHNFSLLILSTLFLHAIASISEKSPKFPIRFE